MFSVPFKRISVGCFMLSIMSLFSPWTQRQKITGLNTWHLGQKDSPFLSFPFLTSSECFFPSFSLSCHFKVWLSLAPRAASSPPASFSELPHLKIIPQCIWMESLCSFKHQEDLDVSPVALNRFLWSVLNVRRGHSGAHIHRCMVWLRAEPSTHKLFCSVQQ